MRAKISRRGLRWAQSWLADRPQGWVDGVEVVAMDGLSWFNTRRRRGASDAVAVMDPFHVVRLAGDALDGCRRRVQQELRGHPGRTSDPLYAAQRTGVDLHTEK